MANILAGIAGSVRNVLVAPGEHVTDGQKVAIVESMKMYIPITAEEEGVVKRILVKDGDFVNDDDILIELEEVSIKNE